MARCTDGYVDLRIQLDKITGCPLSASNLWLNPVVAQPELPIYLGPTSHLPASSTSSLSSATQNPFVQQMQYQRNVRSSSPSQRN